MKKIVYLSDFFLKDLIGGAELADSVIINSLSKTYDVVCRNGNKVTLEDVEQHGDFLIIVSNFNLLTEEIKSAITKKRYFIIEHDHKFLKERDPSPFNNDIAPPSSLKNLQFYRKAEYVFCQSKRHAECLRNNLLLSNVCNFGMSFWTKQQLSLIKNNVNSEKKIQNAVMSFFNEKKGTKRSIGYCIKNKIEYEVLPSNLKFESFIKVFSKVDKFIFFPTLVESFSRLAVEARMLGVSLITNKNLGCLSEPWFNKHKGEDLIHFVENKIEENISVLIDSIENKKNILLLEPYNYPKISLITSMFKGEKYIRKFLDNITSQTIFQHCELLIIDAVSPEDEFPIIEEYMRRFPNIKYVKLEEDPGIYGVWNIGVKMATGQYLTNTNLDDIRSFDQIEVIVNCLEKNPHIDLAYGESYVTNIGNETFEINSSGGKTYPIVDFSREAMIKCLPGCMPVWRKSMHDKAGYFDESFRYAGDHEMWLRAVRHGSEFKRVKGVHGLYYMNPDGLSTSEDNSVKKYKEEQRVFWEYGDIYGQSVVNQYRDYFSRIL
tara:strand:+ start:409 stop:2049 length:1641 start_codon:yes stop_codon:yes gene_type:complete